FRVLFQLRPSSSNEKPHGKKFLSILHRCKQTAGPVSRPWAKYTTVILLRRQGHMLDVAGWHDRLSSSSNYIYGRLINDFLLFRHLPDPRDRTCGRSTSPKCRRKDSRFRIDT